MDAELIIGVVGLAGITATNVARWLGYFARINKGARFFGLKRDEPVDLVLVTSADQQGDNYRRQLTSYDTLRAATHVAERIAELRLRKTTNLRVSERLEDPPSKDLVVLGGSAAPKNRVAKILLEEFNESHPELEILRPRGDGSRTLTVGEHEWRWEAWSEDEKAVNKDVAVIVVWRNPFVFGKRRAIYCAGFTAAGTAAATDYLLTELSRDGRRRSLGWRRINPFLSPSFVSVVEFDFAGNQPLLRREALFRAVDKPAWPLRERRSVDRRDEHLERDQAPTSPRRPEHSASTRHA